MDDIITSQSEFFQNIMTKIDAASNVASELLNNQRKRLCQEHYLSSEEFCRGSISADGRFKITAIT